MIPIDGMVIIRIFSNGYGEINNFGLCHSIDKTDVAISFFFSYRVTNNPTLNRKERYPAVRRKR